VLPLPGTLAGDLCPHVHEIGLLERPGWPLMAASVRSQRDLELARLLAAGATQARAGEQLGISERTVRRRLAEPAFLDLIDQERTAHVERILDGMTLVARRAVTVLSAILDGEQVPPAVKVSAARVALSSVLGWRDQLEMDKRLADVERALRARRLEVVR
jgi:hypothetical protein